MNDMQVRDLFAEVVERSPRARFDVERAIRLGRRSRRIRLAATAGTTLAVAAIAAFAIPPMLRLSTPFTGTTMSSASSAAAPTGFPYSGAAQIHPLPNSNYTAPADLAAVRLPDPAPGFPYRLQPDGLYAMTVGAGPACYGVQFVVATAPNGQPGSTATAIVTDCTPPPASVTEVEGHPVIGHAAVAGVDGTFTQYTSGTPGSTHRNLVLYFTTGHHTTRIEGTGLTQEQLLNLGNALTGLR